MPEGLWRRQASPGVREGLEFLLVKLQCPETMLRGLRDPTFSSQTLQTHTQNPGPPVPDLHFPVMPSCIKSLSGQDAGVLVKSLGTGRQVLVKQQPLHTFLILRHYEFGTRSFRVQGQAGCGERKVSDVRAFAILAPLG